MGGTSEAASDDIDSIHHDEENALPHDSLNNNEESDSDQHMHDENEPRQNCRRRHTSHLLIILLFWYGQKYILPPFYNVVDTLDRIYLEKDDAFGLDGI